MDLLKPEDRSAALYGKFSHPLSGLIGAHSHFLGKDRKEKLEAMVLRNLWGLMPGSPDVIALLLMALDRDEGDFPQSKAELDQEAKRAFGEKISGLLPLTFPPMLNSALQAIMRATQTLPDLVKEGSWLEAAGNSSFGSGSWALWDQPTGRDPFKEEAESQTYMTTSPSTQKLYPAIKKAIAKISTHEAKEIFARARINEFVNPTELTLEKLMLDVNEQVSDYSLDQIKPSGEKVDTVRDLMQHIRVSAKPRSVNTLSSEIEFFRPNSEVEDWLIDLVHDQIDKDNFDAGKIAKRYAVSKRSVERATKLPGSTGVSNVNLGNVAQMHGDLDAAVNYYAKALALDEKIGNEEGMAIAYDNLGDVARTREDLDGAENYFAKALALDEELGNEEGMAIAYGNLGIVARTRGKLDEAVDYWENALALFETIDAKAEVERVQGWLDEVE